MKLDTILEMCRYNLVAFVSPRSSAEQLTVSRRVKNVNFVVIHRTGSACEFGFF